jgi:NADH dehydrogenase [ubiquinone] 1 alpha subcomplex assembly factor 7
MPPLTADSLSTPLARRLAARIALGGPITFHDFMEACLYDAGYGYYKKRDALGRAGDFITAPEISQVFGELIGLWAGESWRLMGEPDSIHLIELGPGRGTLMADALRALRVLPDFLKRVRVHLAESSQPLRDAQKIALVSAPCPVAWHETIESVPEGPSIIIANEFLDCLPVRQFIFDAPALVWRERLVTLKNERFLFASGEPVGVPGAPDARELDDGAIFEVRPAIAALLETCANRAASAPFAALFFDYGHAKPSAGDTVQSVRRHAFAGIFDAPGETDLTAHVDFHSLIEDARAKGLNAFGPMPMGEWLLKLGAEARLNQLTRSASEDRVRDLRGRVARLIDPAQMGLLFKTALLTGSQPGVLPPFSSV